MSKISSLVKFVRLFRNWPLAATVRYRRAKAGHDRRLLFRDGRRLRFSPALEGGVIGEMFVMEAYKACAGLTGVRTVWDIGANIGCFVLWAAAKFPDARFHSFEPALPTFERLKLNREENANVDWTIHPFGFSDRDEIVTAHMPVHGSLQTGRYVTEGQRVPLDLRSIDLFWISQGRPVIDLVKMDCEGGEYCIFLGMSNEMLRNIRAIVMETHPVPGQTYEALAERLRDAGFNVRYQRNPDGNADWYAERPASVE